MIDGYQSPEESVHLRFGIEVHKALQDYEILRFRGVSYDDALRQVIRDCVLRCADWNPDRDSRAGKYKNRDTLVGCIIDYLDHYMDDPAKTVTRADGTPAVELSFSFELGFEAAPGQPYLLCGHLDKVVDFNGDLFVLDHKTSITTLGSYYFDQYNPHNQMTIYTIGGQVVLSAPIRGVIIDAIQILLTEPARCVRGFTFRTQDQLEEWQRDLQALLQVYAAYAEANYYPRNDAACGMYGGCKFREVCSSSPNVRDTWLKKFTKLPPEKRWNPLVPR